MLNYTSVDCRFGQQSPVQRQKFVLFRGDDTDFLGNQTLRVVIDTTLDISACKAHFACLGYRIDYDTIPANKTLELVFPASVTRSFPLGVMEASLVIEDTNKKVRTVENRIRISVTSSVSEAYDNESNQAITVSLKGGIAWESISNKPNFTSLNASDMKLSSASIKEYLVSLEGLLKTAFACFSLVFILPCFATGYDISNNVMSISTKLGYVDGDRTTVGDVVGLVTPEGIGALPDSTVIPTTNGFIKADAVTNKADKATTLSGYGITDALKDDVESLTNSAAFTNAVAKVSPPTVLPSKWAFGDVTNANGEAVTAADVGARPSDWMPTAEEVGAYSKSETDAKLATATNGLASSATVAAHVSATDNPHAVTAEQVGAVQLVEDKYGYKTAVTIGTRMGAVGVNSLANGEYVEASGGYSHAEGYDTTASGDYSHAEGYYTTASAYGSHAEGYYTTASAYGSHAEGYYTTASGDYSHAEGNDTTASAYGSHAEGYYTTASAYGSHAEGYDTTASGYSSHAEGYCTTASGNYSHAEGAFSKTLENDTYAFVWSGEDERRENNYLSHGPGTFNLNPLGGLSGLWIGESTLETILGGYAKQSDIGSRGATNITDGVTSGTYDAETRTANIRPLLDATISPTNPTFSNAVLAVGLNIDTNSVAQINAILSDIGGVPIEGTATTVGGLLLALAAAVAWLKKNALRKGMTGGVPDDPNVSSLFSSVDTSTDPEPTGVLQNAKLDSSIVKATAAVYDNAEAQTYPCYDNGNTEAY